MKKYGCMREAVWISDEIQPAFSKKMTAGIDIGTVSSEAVILCDGKIFCFAIMNTDLDFVHAPQKIWNQMTDGLNLEPKDMDTVVCTGFGHKHVDYAQAYVDEIHCHAKGARYIFGPKVTTVLDLGGQTCKAIRLHKWDRVRDFMVNDKCATGMGYNLQELCELLQIPLDEIGERSLEVAQDPEPVSTTCYAFAQTETMGLFHPGFREEPLTDNEVYASCLFAVAWRILGLAGRLQPLDVGDIAVYPELGLTGGMAKNIGITKRLERELHIQALTGKWDPMLAGAIGAALFAGERK